MVPARGLEPRTLGLKDRCSNQAELRRLNGNCGDSKSRPKPGGLPARLAAPVSLPPMRAPAWLIAVVIAVVSCNPNPSPTPSPEPLAADQTLSFPIAQDIADFDPALISTAADVDILRNVFSGLYRFDDQLREVPDIAVGQPTVSTDGLTYTFRIRTDAKFSNGDPITAGDFVYSWNRAAARQGDYAGLFSIIAGYAPVASGKSRVMTGLNKVDDTTLTAALVKRASYCLTEVRPVCRRRRGPSRPARVQRGDRSSGAGRGGLQPEDHVHRGDGRGRKQGPRRVPRRWRRPQHQVRRRRGQGRVPEVGSDRGEGQRPRLHL